MPYCAIHGAMAVPDCLECNTEVAGATTGSVNELLPPDLTSAALTQSSDLIACPGCDFTAKQPVDLGSHVEKAHKGMTLTSSKSDAGVKTYTLTPA